jgi:hypothetical protein
MKEETTRSLDRPNIYARNPISLFASRWLFFGLTIISVIPFWTVRYPVVTDYPNHLARWFVLFHATDPHYHFSGFYFPAWGPLPYITPDVLAMGLQYVLPIDIVGRCILSLCVILVALATLFFVNKTCGENAGLAMLGILIALNPNFLMGSIGNQFSLAFCLLAAGLWVSYCSSPKVSTAMGILFLISLVYLSHLIGFVIVGMVMGVYTLFQADRWKKLGMLAALSLPALAMFGLNQKRSGSPGVFVYSGLTAWEKLRNLVFPLRFSHSKSMDVLFIASLLVVIILLVRAQKRISIQPVWLAVCGVLLLTYFVAPGEYGIGGYVDVRVLPFLYIFLLAAFRFPRIPGYITVCLALLVLIRVAGVEKMFLTHQGELKQLALAFDSIPRDARVLTLQSVDRKSSLVGRAEPHHLDYGTMERGFLVPTLFHLQGVQPLRLTNDVYCPNVFCFVTDPMDADWSKIAGSYDYLWVQNDPDAIPAASRIGHIVFSNDSVTVLEIYH